MLNGASRVGYHNDQVPKSSLISGIMITQLLSAVNTFFKKDYDQSSDLPGKAVR